MQWETHCQQGPHHATRHGVDLYNRSCGGIRALCFRAFSHSGEVCSSSTKRTRPGIALVPEHTPTYRDGQEHDQQCHSGDG
jgi:hypothetical protein